MKKFTVLLSVFAAISAVSLTSCVKDDESASVENIRNAKAEEYKALAALYTAQGQAELIRAEAEAALKQAEAALKQAEADKEILEYEKAKATAQLEIDKLVMEAEAAKLTAQVTLAEAKKSYEEYRASALADPNPYLDGLVAQYTTEITKLTGLQTDLVNAKAALMRAQYGLADRTELVAEETQKQNTVISTQSAIKEALEAIATDQASVESALKEAEIAEGKLQGEVNAASAEWSRLEQIANESDKTFNNDDPISKAIAAWSSITASYSDLSGAVITETRQNKVTDEKTGQLYLGTSFTTLKFVDASVFAIGQRRFDEAVTDAQKALDEANGQVTEKTAEEEKAFAEEEKAYKARKEAETAKTTADEAVAEAQRTLTNAKDEDKEAAQKALEAAVKAQGEAAKKLTEAQDAYTKAKTAYDTAKTAADQLRNSIASLENTLQTAKDNLTAYTEAVSALTDADALKAHNAALETALTDDLAVVNANITKTNLNTELNVQKGIVTALRNVATGYDDLENQIATCEQAIKDAERYIELYCNADSEEDIVALKTAELDAAETELEVLQARIDALKAEIDAQMGGTTGGGETDAE